MGMIGYYFRADEDLVDQMKKGESGNILFNKDYEKNLLDIDKAWHAIHFVLTGEAWEVPGDDLLSCVVLGGHPVNDEDMGYGPARLLDKELVKKIAEVLDDWDEEAFRGKFLVKDMIENQVYPVMNDENEQEFFEYVWFYFVELKKFFKVTADRNEYIVSFIA